MYWRYLSYWLIGVAFDNSQIPLFSSKNVLSELDLEFKSWISTVIKSKTFVKLSDTILFGSRKARNGWIRKARKKEIQQIEMYWRYFTTDWSE